MRYKWIMFAALISTSGYAAEVTLDNQVSGDGHLNVTVDDFGSFAEAFAGGPDWKDFFDPSPDPKQGPIDEEYATFSTNVYFFIDPSGVGNGTHRVALSAHGGLLNTYDDANLQLEIIEPNITDVLPLATASAFTVSGAGINLRVDLAQTVDEFDAGPDGERRALLAQRYRITNNGSAINLIVTKHIDLIMSWAGGGPNTSYLDDRAGVDFSELLRPQIVAQDKSLVTGALVLRTREDMTADPDTLNFHYYAGKQNTSAPPGNPEIRGGQCPEHDFGTDFQIWNNYGLPNCWKDFVPGVGYNVPGMSPEISGDTFMGLQVEATIGGGGQYEVTFVTIYGYRPEPTRQIPPALESQTVAYDAGSGCGEFMWTVRNINPVIPGEVPLSIEEFYLDVETGDGDLNNPCFEVVPPAGWSAEECARSVETGHVLYRFNGDSIEPGREAIGRVIAATNGVSDTVNADTGVVVPPLSVVLHAAQAQLDDNDEPQPCTFAFGPGTDGDWSSGVAATAFLPVPSLTTWARAILMITICAAGVVLLLRRAGLSPTIRDQT